MNNEEKTSETFPEEFLISDLVTIIYKSYKRYLMYKIADLNITFGQIPFVLELMHSKIVSQDELAKKLFLTRGATAKTLRKLDDEEIVERKTATNNRRKYDVYLTEKGKKTALEIEKIDKYWEDMVISQIEELKEFGDKEKIFKLLKCLAKSSFEIFSEESEKIKDSNNLDDNCGMLPFGEIHFSGDHIKNIVPQGNFFRTKGCFDKRNRKKL